MGIAHPNLARILMNNRKKTIIDFQQHYTLLQGETEKIIISWGFFSKEIVIYFEDQEIGRIPKSKLAKPHEFVLRNGSRLEIQQIPSFKILGMGCRPYLQLNLDGRKLLSGGAISSPKQLEEKANGWIFVVVLLKFIHGIFWIFSPSKASIIPVALGFREFIEWQQGFAGSLITGLILLGLLFLPLRSHRLLLITVLVIILVDVLLGLSCGMICKVPNIVSNMAIVEGFAIISIYQSLRKSRLSSRL